MAPEFETSQKSQVTDSFRKVLDEVAATPGKRVDIVNSSNDTFGGFMRTFSMHTGIVEEGKIKEGLRQLILENVPEGETQDTLEAGFKEEADCVGRGSHGDTYRLEWNLIRDNVVIGLEVIRDQRSESVRTWYLRNTSKKPGLIPSILSRFT